MLALYISGISIGYPLFILGLIFFILFIINNRKNKKSNFNIESNLSGLKKIYTPFILWLILFSTFVCILIALFSTVMIASGSY